MGIANCGASVHARSATSEKHAGIPDALARARHPRRTARTFARRIDMLDIVFIATTVAFFAVSLAYVRGCDRL